MWIVNLNKDIPVCRCPDEAPEAQRMKFASIRDLVRKKLKDLGGMVPEIQAKNKAQLFYEDVEDEVMC